MVKFSDSTPDINKFIAAAERQHRRGLEKKKSLCRHCVLSVGTEWLRRRVRHPKSMDQSLELSQDSAELICCEHGRPCLVRQIEVAEQQRAREMKDGKADGYENVRGGTKTRGARTNMML